MPGSNCADSAGGSIRCGGYWKIVVDRARQGLGETVPVGSVRQQLFLVRVRQTADLDQGRGMSGAVKTVKPAERCGFGNSLVPRGRPPSRSRAPESASGFWSRGAPDRAGSRRSPAASPAFSGRGRNRPCFRARPAARSRGRRPVQNAHKPIIRAASIRAPRRHGSTETARLERRRARATRSRSFTRTSRPPG